MHRGSVIAKEHNVKNFIFGLRDGLWKMMWIRKRKQLLKRKKVNEKKMKSLRNALNVISAFKEYLQRHIDTEHEGKKQGYFRKKP